MSRAYSSDLRERVIKCFISKMKHKEIAEKLDVSVITVKRYSIKYKKTGNLSVEKRQANKETKINDFEKLRDFVKENNHFSLSDMAQKWGNVSYSTFQRAVKKAG